MPDCNLANPARNGECEVLQRCIRGFVGGGRSNLQHGARKNPRLLNSGETPRDTYHQMWSTILAGGTWQGDILNRRKSGELFWNCVRLSCTL